jgi:hypothetical protein
MIAGNEYILRECLLSIVIALLHSSGLFVPLRSHVFSLVLSRNVLRTFLDNTKGNLVEHRRCESLST